MLRSIRDYIIVLILFGFGLSQVDYTTEIDPIFSSCTGCHGNYGGLSLTSYDNLMEGDSNHGPVVEPYDHSISLLWEYVDSGEMPPSQNDLTSAQIDLINKWIEEGALSTPAGCTDPEAYNCADDDGVNYTFDVGPIQYVNGCNYELNDNLDLINIGGCDESAPCEGFFNPNMTVDNGTCDYYQAPSGDDVFFLVEENSIRVDWSNWVGISPLNATILGYHVSRCVDTGCVFFTDSPFPWGTNDGLQDTWIIDEFEWVPGVEIKYAINVYYLNAEAYGMAIGASYITPGCSADGNVNGDETNDGEDIWDVLDIVILANCVLAQNCGDSFNTQCAGDINNDGSYNVLDIVQLANCILGNNCGGRIDDATASKLIIIDDMVSIEADGFIGGVQMTLQHGKDFSIIMKERALFADYITEGKETRLLVINPETDELFSFEGEFEITDLIVANSHAEVSASLPLAVSFGLSDAYPNPFNPTTTLELSMPVAGDMQISVYNLLGQVVATLASGYMNANTYTLTWDATDAASGMYFVKAQTDGFTATQKLMLVK